MNQYCIRTVKDMMTVVKPESLDIFLQDLRQVFEVYYKIKEQYDILPVLEQFDWIDDGQNNISIKVIDHVN